MADSAGTTASVLRPVALCVNERQVEQTEFHNRHTAEFVSFWSQRALEAKNMPDDRVKALELRTRAVKRIMRAAVLETLNDSRSQDTNVGRPAVRGPAHPHFIPSSSRANGRDGGAGSNAHGGKEPTVTSAHGHSAGSQTEGQGDEDKTYFSIRDDACFVMARACELFAMDIAKRSELVLEDQHRRGQKTGYNRAQLKRQEVLTAIDNTDYCDFLVDLVQQDR